jgi:signal transduction histidine kinase
MVDESATGSSTYPVPDGTEPGELTRPLAESLMGDLVAHASDVLAVQTRLRRLVRANRLILAELSLPAVLRRVVEAARDIVGAKYAALCVISAEGTLEQFVHVGMDEQTVASIGRLPECRGLSGVVIKDRKPIRVADISRDPRSSDFPPNHPDMKTFLGVPILSRGEVFGILHLADRLKGEFNQDDEDLAAALAATASVAIENARLYEESHRRQEWLQASLEIGRILLAGEEGTDATLWRIADTVRRLAPADGVSIVRPAQQPDQLEVAVAVGAGQETLQGYRYPKEGSLAWAAMTSGRGALVEVSEAPPDKFVPVTSVQPVSSVMTSPLIGEGAPRGAIVVGRRPGARPFGPPDLELVEGFANQAAIALELADGRADQQRLTVLEDRTRIARDLHDHVIQRLFATGLSLQATAAGSHDRELRDRLIRSVDELDETIKQIRTSIFQLRDVEAGTALRSQVMQVVAQLGTVFHLKSTVRFDGPVDTVSDPALVADVEAVVREAVTNAAKHARADEVEVDVSADAQSLRLIVSNNGGGMTAATRRSGLANLRERAERRGGTMIIESRSPEGTRLTWSVPA